MSDAVSTTTTQPADNPGALVRFGRWLVSHRMKLYPVIGFIGIVIVCPRLPPEFQGPCRMVATAFRTGTFDGLQLP